MGKQFGLVSDVHVSLEQRQRRQRLRRQGVAPISQLLLPSQQQLEPEVHQVGVQWSAASSISCRRTR